MGGNGSGAEDLRRACAPLSQRPPGTAGPPRRLLTAPVLPGRLLPARPRASRPPRSRVSLAAATPAPRATPAGARYSLRKRATQRRLLPRLGLGGGRALGTWLRTAKAPDPPPRVSRRPLIHTRGSGGLLVRVSRGRHPPQRTRGRPAPSDHRTRRLLSTGRAAEPRGAPGGSRHRGRGRRSPGPLFDRGSKSFKNVTRPMALKRRDAKPSGTVPRQQSHEDTPGRFLWSRARGPGPCGGCGVAHTPQGHGDSGLTGCPRERGRRPALHTVPRDGPREPSALKARSWRSTPRRPRPRGPRAAVGLTLRTGDAPEDPAAAVLLPGRNTRGRTRPGPGLWLSPRAGPSDHPTTTPARKPRRSCRV